ncbi:MAG: hypothetical protein KDE58_17250, partial [Caldilineaceae bacterium]|nr:hypothetical protein [Caldilineaceae bacterium]
MSRLKAAQPKAEERVGSSAGGGMGQRGVTRMAMGDRDDSTNGHSGDHDDAPDHSEMTDAARRA